MKKIVLFAAVAGMAALAAGTALAAPNVVVTRDTYLYKNSSGNTVVGEVERGEELEVTTCGPQRCRVKMPGPDPYIRRNRIEPIEDDEDEDDPDSSVSITLGPGGISIGVGGGSGGGGGGTGPTSGPRVCIYEHEGYGGARRCFAEGSVINNLTSLGWNDIVSSVRTYGGAGAQICEHAGGGGACYAFNANASSLGTFNDMASYIEVY